MDNDQLACKISIIGILKHRYIGSFPADMIPDIIPADSFFICNTESSKRPGSHWAMLSKKNGIVDFGDSLGNDPMFYRNIVLKHFDALKILNRVELQKEPLCGLYCFYFVFSLFSNFRRYDVDDNFISRFFCGDTLECIST